MFGRNFSAIAKILFVFFVLSLGTNHALAYVGPGVDVSLISQFMALLGFAAAACSAVLMWPVYALLRRLRGRRSPTEIRSRVESAPSPHEIMPENARASGPNAR